MFSSDAPGKRCTGQATHRWRHRTNNTRGMTGVPLPIVGDRFGEQIVCVTERPQNVEPVAGLQHRETARSRAGDLVQELDRAGAWGHAIEAYRPAQVGLLAGGLWTQQLKELSGHRIERGPPA